MRLALALWAVVLASCATPGPSTTQRIDALLPADVILLGEQHDALEHQRIERDVIQSLAARGVLVANAMADRSLDRQLPGPALKAQQQEIRIGHCGLLPENQISPMTRIQIARDRAMAQTVAGAYQRGQTVLLVAGAGHVRRGLGVPVYLPGDLTKKVLVAQSGSAPDAINFGADAVWETAALPIKDPCAELQRTLQATPTQPE